MTRRCSPDIIEEASPPEAAAATAVTAFPPHWSLTRFGAQRSTCRPCRSLEGRGRRCSAAFPERKLPLWLGAHKPSPLRDPRLTRRSERPGEADRANLPSRQLLLAARALHASPTARAPSPALGRRTHEPRARASPALPLQTVASARALLATSPGAQPERARGRAHRSEKEAAAASASNRSGRRELTSSAAALFRSLFLYFGVSEKKLYLEDIIFFFFFRKWRWPRVSGRFSLHQDGLCLFRRGHSWWLDCQSSPGIFEARSRALHVGDSPSGAAGRLGLGLGGAECSKLRAPRALCKTAGEPEVGRFQGETAPGLSEPGPVRSAVAPRACPVPAAPGKWRL